MRGCRKRARAAGPGRAFHPAELRVRISPRRSGEVAIGRRRRARRDEEEHLVADRGRALDLHHLPRHLRRRVLVDRGDRHAHALWIAGNRRHRPLCEGGADHRLAEARGGLGHWVTVDTERFNWQYGGLRRGHRLVGQARSGNERERDSQGGGEDRGERETRHPGRVYAGSLLVVSIRPRPAAPLRPDPKQPASRQLVRTTDPTSRLPASP
jgi:hypothetical protein